MLGRYGCWFYSLNILIVLVPQELELEVSQLHQDREQLETDCKKIQANLNSKTQLLNTQEEVRRVYDRHIQYFHSTIYDYLCSDHW